MKVAIEDALKDLFSKLNRYFHVTIEFPRIMRGERQQFETLINEEALLFAKFLRREKEARVPRIVILS